MIAITVHSAGMLQAKQLTAPPISRQLSKDFLNPLPLLGMPLDMALPTSGPRPSSTHQWAGKGPALQENFTSLWTASPTRGQNARKPQSCRLWTQPVPSRWNPVLGPAGPQSCLLTGQYKLQDTPDSIPNCVRNYPLPYPAPVIWHQLGIPGPWGRTPGHGSACWSSGTNSRTWLHPPSGWATALEFSGPWPCPPVSQH